MTDLVIFSKSLCSGCQDVKELLWTKRRDIYHKVKRFNVNYLDGLTELAERDLINVAKEKGFPILVEEYDCENIKEVFTDMDTIKEKILGWPIAEGEYVKSWAPC